MQQLLKEVGSFKQEVGAWGFLKSTLSYNTGLIMDDKLALSAALLEKLAKVITLELGQMHGHIFLVQHII